MTRGAKDSGVTSEGAWRRRVRAALRAGARTPFFLFAADPLDAACGEVMRLDFGKGTRHWYSFKTQPVPAVLRWWRDQGWPVEVVSEFEFRGARAARFEIADILVNGPLKHRWLPEVAMDGMRVNFDSVREMMELLPVARRRKWRMGIRLQLGATGSTSAVGGAGMGDAFGMTQDEARVALKTLRGAGLAAETLHFHLRTNLPTPEPYRAALREAAAVCRALDWRPIYLDSGGGAPPERTWDLEGRASSESFQLRDWARVYREMAGEFPSVREYWFENGRRLLASSGVAVFRIWDEKVRGKIRRLMCDGGRTLNAMVSTWEQHRVAPVEIRRGRSRLTAVHGPTCMAFDRCFEGMLPETVGCGDHLMWMEAGAYHIPWETRFSHGLAEVWWVGGEGVKRVREAEGFEGYWREWKG